MAKDLTALTDEALIVEARAAAREYGYALRMREAKTSCVPPALAQARLDVAEGKLAHVGAEMDRRGLSLAEYSDDQPRDDDGKFGSGGGGAPEKSDGDVSGFKGNKESGRRMKHTLVRHGGLSNAEAGKVLAQLPKKPNIDDAVPAMIRAGISKERAEKVADAFHKNIGKASQEMGG